MKRIIVKVFLIFGIWTSLFNLANATTITYQVNSTGGDTWEYIYSVTNDTLLTDIEEFTVYFEYGLYSNLSVDTQKTDWDGLAVERDIILGIPTSGYYDAAPLPSVSGIAPGVTEGGFRVSFTWLGTGAPGTQDFDVFDPVSFDILESGTTALGQTTAVPEPATIGLFLIGALGLLWFRRKMQ